jgi:hypothetical protein
MPMNDRDIDGILAAIRNETATPTADLKARMLADARAVAHAPSQTVVVPPARRASWLDRMANVLGGWMPTGALTSCLVLGVLIGALPEGALPLGTGSDDAPMIISLSLGDTLFAEVTP